MERRIPHVRDVFNDMRSYDYSPRSRRKESDSPLAAPRHHAPNNNQHQQQQQSNQNRHPDKTTGVTPGGGAGTQQTNALTERDFRHLERHLSMKKTIRKQISRNLAQAFVEDPKVLCNNAVNNNHSRQPPAQQPQVITLTRAKIARSDQTFLDMLKEPSNKPVEDNNNAGRTVTESCSSNQQSFWKFLGIKGKGKR
ncbi:uncharacterized protein LOC119433183 [Dermacentor silvarum]|uniref:uncharacterized protein LOC119433183 n=1 Tax=Dermacentor silvarum TaxID=543639 RepID=UPI00189BC228|nr:uncharacterized protein LOC119433183 [Dermacentor silvarum]XP_037556253.1 uncharacterized protein LOC119433183 [Dermacentor silvarum]XP_049514634.1 uncharacterized protein LOC119433183 [Dermacentor silvarum]